MMQWEYKHVFRSHGSDLFYELNQIGGEGWEMCGVITDQVGYTFFFKRQVL